MYSPEFMKFLIDYQKPEYNGALYKKTKYFNFKKNNNRLASILLLLKK